MNLPRQPILPDSLKNLVREVKVMHPDREETLFVMHPSLLGQQVGQVRPDYYFGHEQAAVQRRKLEFVQKWLVQLAATAGLKLLGREPSP